MFRYAELVLLGQILLGFLSTILLPSKLVFKVISSVFLVYSGWFGIKYIWPYMLLILSKVVEQYSFPKLADFIGYHFEYFSYISENILTFGSLPFIVSFIVINVAIFWLNITFLNRVVSQKIVAPFIIILLYVSYIYSTFLISIPLMIVYLTIGRPSAENMRILVAGSEVVPNELKGISIIRGLNLFKRTAGIYIHEFLRISLKSETTGFLFLGMPGSGKTNVIFQFLTQIFKRKDKQIIYDYKGDFTQAVGEDSSVLIFSPFDARSVTWDMGKDIDTSTKAAEFVSMIVPTLSDNSDKDFFPGAAQDVLIASILSLQAELGKKWLFSDFYKRAQDKEKIVKAIREFRPESELLFDEEMENEQSAGILGTIRIRLARLEPIARAWNSRGNLFSYSDWVTNDDADKRTVIVKTHARYENISGTVVSMIFEMIFKEILSLPDSKSRIIWAVFDELQLLPRIPSLLSITRAARSKGLRVIVGTQDFGKTKKSYERDGGTEAFINGFAFKFLGRLDSPETIEYASRMSGKNDYHETKRNVTVSEKGSSITLTKTKVSKQALESGSFSGLPEPDLIRPAFFWLKHPGWPIVKLRYQIKVTPSKYPSQIDAVWMSDRDINAPKQSVETMSAGDASAATRSVKRDNQ
ncbi:MAG: type IV secretion system DNA-binding domain-containing protein, partial [Flavobacteriaceae bacterium]|nr:type IV secretion system DNA-binding domain-containing protein [Flavobacteriaceae bacterium]